MLRTLTLVLLLCAPLPAQAKKPDPLSRIGIIGASVSAGFGTQSNLGEFMDAAVKTPHKIINAGDPLFFMGPVPRGKAAVARMKKEGATVVFGLDFMFWFSYGFLDFKGRQALLEKGCAYVAQLKCPVFLGDLPDMSAAAGGMLAAAQIPKPEEIKALNRQLRAWGAKHPNVHIVPLSKWVNELKAEKPITINGKARTFKKTELIQADHLHATMKGTALLTLMCLERMVIQYPATGKRRIVWNPGAVLAAVQKKMQPKK
jgi:hypothetical protein